jgi:hypothetical protein
VSRLLARLRWVAANLRQVRIVKPTFGRPRLRCEVRSGWSFYAEQWVRPDLSEIPAVDLNEAEAGLFDAYDLAQELPDSDCKQESSSADRDGR